MERAELIERLKGHEWTDVEFKRAQGGVPESAYETVSAFSNTGGGWLVFGVRDGAGGFEIVGVMEVDKVQNDFLSVLRSGQKLNRVVAVKERLIEEDGKALLVFHIPEARRRDKPVYLGGDIRKSFIRRGAGDERCTPGEIERLLRDAADQHYDGQAVGKDPETAFDSGSVRWYRETYERRPGNRSWVDLSDLDFLDEMGLLVEQDGRRMPTRAAVLLFGNNPSFRQLLPRPVVDCQRFALARAQADTGARWMDRSVLDENLIRTWRSLVDWYGRFAERPFRIDPVSLQRDDTPPDYPAYRESMVNLLIHQDYSDHARNPEIRHYIDQAVFWNPGDAFASVTDLLEPGEKEVRNPRIVTAFRRIGLSENAGWGLRDIFRSWQQLGNVPPRITNDKSRKRFELVLLKEELLSEEQILFQKSLGVRLTDEQARAFAFICRDGEATLAQLKAVTGLPGPDTVEVAERLETQRLIDSVGGAGRYALAEHLREGAGPSGRGGARVDRGQVDLPTGQVGPPTPDLVTDQVGQPRGNLFTGQVDPPTPDLPTRQVGPPTPDLPTSQVDPPTPDLVTDQADVPDPRLVTDQAGADTSNLITDQVGVPTTRLVSDQVGPDALDSSSAQIAPSTQLSATQWKIVALCEVPRSMADLMVELGMSHRAFFRRTHLESLLRGGVIRMIHPDQPNHPGQAYVLTEAGAALKAHRAGAGAGTRGGG